MSEKNVPTKATKPAPRAAENDEKSKKLIAQLEAVVADTPDRRAVWLKAMTSTAAVEPHRDFQAYVLGADAFTCGLASSDSLALMGVMSLGPKRVAELLLALVETYPNMYVTRLWPIIIDANRDEYHARGKFVSWQRRWSRYLVDAESWEARQIRDGRDDWRVLHMTPGQRYLVQECAIMLKVVIPLELIRGSAHDWLMTHGANVVYRKEI